MYLHPECRYLIAGIITEQFCSPEMENFQFLRIFLIPELLLLSKHVLSVNARGVDDSVDDLAPVLANSFVSLGSLSLASFLKKICQVTNCEKHTMKLGNPLWIDIENREIVYQNSMGRNMQLVRIKFDDFNLFYDFAFSESPTFEIFLDHSLPNFLRMIRGALDICSLEYISRKNSRLLRRIALCSRLMVRDYSRYKELENYQIPASFFHRVLHKMYSKLKVVPLDGSGSDGKTDYMVTYSDNGHRPRPNRTLFTSSDAFCFYACRIKKIDKSASKRFYKNSLSSQGYMHLLEHPESN